jgi:hypothetical protein
MVPDRNIILFLIRTAGLPIDGPRPVFYPAALLRRRETPPGGALTGVSGLSAARGLDPQLVPATRKIGNGEHGGGEFTEDWARERADHETRRLAGVPPSPANN